MILHAIRWRVSLWLISLGLMIMPDVDPFGYSEPIIPGAPAGFKNQTDWIEVTK